MGEPWVNYDEASLKARLGRLDRSQKTAFSAACAEYLWPLFLRYTEATGNGDVAALETILDGVWQAALDEEVNSLAEAQQVAEDMVPTDEGVWSFEMGYGQNAIAAVAYAVRTWLTADPQEAAWAARQVYEAADYASQKTQPDLVLNTPGAEESLLQSPIVQTALLSLSSNLTSVEAGSSRQWGDLRERARQEGEAWASTMP